MVRAAATGRLDYREADSNSRKWKFKERLMLNDVEREHLNELSRLKQLQQVSTAIWPTWDDKGAMFHEHYKRGNEHLMDIGKRLVPYIEWGEGAYYKSEAAVMRAEYIKKFGDPSSPEALAQQRRDKEALRRHRVEVTQQAAADAEAQREREKTLQDLRTRRHVRPDVKQGR